MSSTGFTESDIKLLTRAWLCIDGGLANAPKMDLEKMAEVVGFSNKQSARVMWNTVKRKLATISDTGVIEEATPKKTPKKRAVATADEETPKKRGRKSKAEIAAATAAKDEDNEGGEGEEVKKVKEENGENEHDDIM